MQTRRQFMASAGAATALLGILPRQTLATVPFEALEAIPASVQLAPDGYPATDIWGYDGTAPGPVLRGVQGGRLQRRFANSLPQASSIHWHGIRIDNAMDGVPGLTQAAVEPGAVSTMTFCFRMPEPIGITPITARWSRWRADCTEH